MGFREKIKMKFDICIPTKNSEKYIRTCLDSVINVFGNRIKRIIIVDGYSDDNTIKIIETFTTFPIKVYFSSKKLGKVREFMIEKVKTKWFWFIDSDVKVNKRWFDIMISNIEKNIGAIQGFALPSNALLRKIRMVKRPERGFTSNTLIRTKAVKGIKLPNIPRGEDDLIKEFIENKGFRWKYVPAYCDHLKPTGNILRDLFIDFLVFNKMYGIKKAIKI